MPVTKSRQGKGSSVTGGEGMITILGGQGKPPCLAEVGTGRSLACLGDSTLPTPQAQQGARVLGRA